MVEFNKPTKISTKDRIKRILSMGKQREVFNVGDTELEIRTLNDVCIMAPVGYLEGKHRDKNGQRWLYRKRTPDRERQGKIILTEALSPKQLKKEEFADNSGVLTTFARDDTDGLTRETFSDLEQDMVSDAISSAGCMLYGLVVPQIIKPYLIQPPGDDDRKNKIRTAICDGLLRTSRFKKTLNQLSIHLPMWGNSLVFPMYNSKGKIENFVPGDLRVYDFIKENGLVTTTNGIVPKGFEVTVWSAISSGSVTDIQGKKFLWDKDCWHLAINQIHLTEWGWGYVELSHDQIEQRINLSEGRTTRTVREGRGVPLLRYGNEKHPPTIKMHQQAKLIMNAIIETTTKGLVIPDYIEVTSLDDQLSYEKAKNSIDQERYLNQMSAGIMGIPISVLMMSSVESGDAKLQRDLEPFFEWHVRYIANNLRLDDLFTAWCRDHGLIKDHERIFVEFDLLMPNAIKERILAIHRAAKGRALPQVKEMPSYIAHAMGLPQDIVESIREAPPVPQEEPKGRGGPPPLPAPHPSSPTATKPPNQPTK